MAKGDLARKILARRREKHVDLGDGITVIVRQPSAIAGLALASYAKSDKVDFAELHAQHPHMVRDLVRACCYDPEDSSAHAFEDVDVEQLPGEAFTPIFQAIVELIGTPGIDAAKP